MQSEGEGATEHGIELAVRPPPPPPPSETYLLPESGLPGSFADEVPAFPPPAYGDPYLASSDTHSSGGSSEMLASEPRGYWAEDGVLPLLGDERSGFGPSFSSLHTSWPPLSSDHPYEPYEHDDASQAEDTTVDASEQYGRIPQRQPRRHHSLRRVELHDGHLVLDCPVPTKLLQRLPIKTGREFTHMRYTAVTCDPDQFFDDRYALRAILFDPPRRTELFIIITMYNEDEHMFTRTMHHVMMNISYLCSRSKSQTWGPDGWKRVVVGIIADGRHKVHSRTLSVLAAMGVYQEGVGKNAVHGVPVEAHLYEYTTQISVDPSLKFRSAERGVVPVQVLLCIKEKNRKKINSHRWAFNAFGRVLEPNVCVLIDAGTQPRPRSIYRLWKAFDRNSNVGGACGEIVAMKGMLWSALLNPLVAAQNFEYKMSNILDKPMESAFGYIGVLPGAFSAYRYVALQNDALGNGPLCSYFKGETLQGGTSDADIFSSNMYLAEDRILCWELVSKRNSSWVLHYVKRAQAVTDVPEQAPELITQRRRWLNGSFFAAIHSIIKFGYIYRSSHPFGRKLLFHVEMIYQAIQLFFSWFAMANYYISFCILTDALASSFHWLKIPTLILQYIYVAFLVFCYLLSMGNRPVGSKAGYQISMGVFAVLTLYMFAAVVYLTVSSIKGAVGRDDPSELMADQTFITIVISLVSTFGIWLIAGIIFAEPWHIFTSIVQYLLMAPSFVNVINIYALCNTHDVSWGTKGSDKAANDLGNARAAQGNEVEVAIPTEDVDLNNAYEDACLELVTKPPKVRPTVNPEARQRDYYATVRTNVVLVWTITNAALAIGILHIGSYRVRTIYMAVLLYTVAALSLFRLIGAIVYLVRSGSVRD